jgi:hypothetical protein
MLRWGGAILALAVLIVWPSGEGPPPTDVTSAATAEPHFERGLDAPQVTERIEDVAVRFAFAGPSEPGEDPLSERWNEMASAERIEVLTASFRSAVEDLRSGVDVERNLETAEGALTALRSELYPTTRGRKRHEAMEAELDRVRTRETRGHREDEP